MFRFTIRELVLLTAVVARIVNWSLDHVRLSRQVAYLTTAAALWEYRAGAVVDAMSHTGWHFEWAPGGVEIRPPMIVE